MQKERQERPFPAERCPKRDYSVCQEMKVSRWELGEGRELTVPWKSSS